MPFVEYVQGIRKKVHASACTCCLDLLVLFNACGDMSVTWRHAYGDMSAMGHMLGRAVRMRIKQEFWKERRANASNVGSVDLDLIGHICISPDSPQLKLKLKK